MNVIDKDIKRLIKKYGKDLDYYPARFCSCVAKNNGTPDPDCSCNLGFYYPTEPEVVRVLKQNFSEKFLNTEMGIIYNGGCKIAIPKYFNGVAQSIYDTISKGDVFVDKSFNRRDTDNLIRGTRDKIYAFNVSKILSVAVENTLYIQGIDFNVTEEESAAGKLTNIVWEANKGPDIDEHYTVEFICNQQFKVWDDGAAKSGTDSQELPIRIKCVLRKFVNPDKSEIDKINPEE